MHKKSAYRQLNWRKAGRSLPQVFAGLGMLFVSVGVIAGILYSVTGLQTSQDLRRDAAGEVTYDLYTSDTDIQIAKKNANGITLEAFLFADGFLLQDQKDVTYTWQTDSQGVVSLATPTTGSDDPCISGVGRPCPAGIRVELKPLAVGSTSIRVVAQKNGLQVGTAETTIAVVERLDDNKNAVSVPFEDLFFTGKDQNYARFYTDKEKNTEVTLSELQSGKQYWIEYTISINNKLKSEYLGKFNLLASAVVNGETFQNDLEYYQVAMHRDGYSMSGLKQFTARPTNTVQFLIDSNERFAEADENNNTYNLDFSAVVKERQYNSCNQRCSNNAECDAGLSCVQVGSDKRCRNPQNTASTSCGSSSTQATSTSGSADKSCNEGCANSSECSVGLTCWYNKCRNPQYLESTSCGTATGGIQAQTQTVAGCNQACAGNGDCSSGLRCYQNTCRYPLNPTSPSCSPQTNTANTTKGGSQTTTPSQTSGGTLVIPSGTTRPTASSTPRPTASSDTAATTSAEATTTPVPSPITPEDPVGETPDTSNETAYDALSLGIGSYISGLFSAESIGGIPLPLVVIGLGVLFLVIAVVLVVISSLRKSKSTTSIKHSSDFSHKKADATKTPPPFTPAGPATPPPAPGVLQQARQQHTLNALQQQKTPAPRPIEQITRPDEKPAVPPATAAPATTQPTQPTTQATPPTPPQPASPPAQAPTQTAPAPTQTTPPADSPTPTSDAAQKKPSSLVERLKQKGIDVPAKPNG